MEEINISEIKPDSNEQKKEYSNLKYSYNDFF